MALSVSTLTRSFNGGSSTAPSTASITPTSNALVLATLFYVRATGTAEVPTVSGNGLTWVLVKNIIVDGGQTACATWAALGASPSSGAVTWTFPNTHEEFLWEVIEFTGAPLNTAQPYGNVNFVNTIGPATSGSPLTVTLSAFSDAGNRPYAVAVHRSTNGMSIEAGWTALHNDFWANVLGRSAWHSSSPDTTFTFWQNSGVAVGIGGYAFEIGDVQPGGGGSTFPALTVAL